MQAISAPDLLNQFTSLATTFSQLGARLSQAASALQDPGLPPPTSLLAELVSCRRDFADLCTNVLSLAENLTVAPFPVPAEIASLNDLRPLLQRVGEVEQKKAAVEGIRRQALLQLDRVLAIVRRDGSNFPPLLECQGRARELHNAIAEVAWPRGLN